MGLKNKIKKYLTHPGFLLIRLDERGVIRLNDRKFIELKYEETMGTKPDIDHPSTFDEKLQWLKLNDHNPEYLKMVDKAEAKGIIEKKLGKDYVIPTIGVYSNFDDIDFDKLPNQLVIKCTHDSGGVYVIKDKAQIDFKKLRKEITKSLKKNFFYTSREWPYKDIPPRIIIEEYREDSDGELKDYKFYCFDGRVDYCMCCVGRLENDTRFYYFDRSWNLIKEFSRDGMERPAEVPKPKNLNKMFKIAEDLSKGLPFVRIDLYNVDGKIYFGEYTFYPSAGFDETRVKAARDYLNGMLNIGELK